MSKFDVLWRTRHKGLPPRPIKLEIPGWSGHDLDHGDGATPQPGHCPPFVEGSTYGLELVYPFDAECSVSVRDGELHFDGDFAGGAPSLDEGSLVQAVRSKPLRIDLVARHFGAR